MAGEQIAGVQNARQRLDGGSNRAFIAGLEMTEAQREQRRYALAISGGVCEVCGRPLSDGQPQGAHRIGNTKANRAKYGDMVIDHPLNVGYTCSLKCNAALDISRNPAECIKLCKRIYEREALKYEGTK